MTDDKGKPVQTDNSVRENDGPQELDGTPIEDVPAEVLSDLGVPDGGEDDA